MLLDTNILVRNINRSDPQHVRVASHLAKLTSGGTELLLAPQTLFEFWVVATRSTDANGLGLSVEMTREHIDLLTGAFILVADPADLFARWLDLCTAYGVKGLEAHDTRLVAWMLGNGERRILTLNLRDFSGYSEIECVVPPE